MPALVIDAANERGQLGTEMSDKLGGKAVAHRMQCRAQRRIRGPLVVEAELRADLVQPFVRFLYRRIQNGSLRHLILHPLSRMEAA